MTKGRFCLIALSALSCGGAAEDAFEERLARPDSSPREVVHRPHPSEAEESAFIAANFADGDGFVDAEESLYWQVYRERDAIYQHMALFDTAGTLLDSVPGLRGHHLYLRDVLGDSDRETIISHIAGDEMSFFPVTWSVYALTPNNKLKRVLEYPKAYYFADGGCKGCEFTCFTNRFHFYAPDSLRIETIFAAESCFDDEQFLPGLDRDSPFNRGQAVYLHYDRSAGAFVPRE